MSSRTPEHTSAEPPSAAGNSREPRADARRNREQVLRTAQQLFASQGLGISIDEIARRAGVGPGTVHRHFPAKEALYLAVAIDQIRQLVTEGEALTGTDDPAALFTLLSRMMASGAENAAVKSALTAVEFDLRDAAPDVAADLTHQVAHLLDRAHRAGCRAPRRHSRRGDGSGRRLPLPRSATPTRTPAANAPHTLPGSFLTGYGPNPDGNGLRGVQRTLTPMTAPTYHQTKHFHTADAEIRAYRLSTLIDRAALWVLVLQRQVVITGVWVIDDEVWLRSMSMRGRGNSLIFWRCSRIAFLGWSRGVRRLPTCVDS